MAASPPGPSIDDDLKLPTHHYHCVLRDVPSDVPLNAIAPCLVPAEDSTIVKELGARGCRIVPHQLHMYRERLNRKFGFASFFAAHAEDNMEEQKKQEIHALVKRWIAEELKKQLAEVKCDVSLAQPSSECLSFVFLEAMNQRCPMLAPAEGKDTQKLRTFTLSKIRFVGEDELKDSASPVGVFNVGTLQPLELVWLKAQLPAFPALLITNGDMSTTHCEEDKLLAYFTENLGSQFKVTK